MLFGTYNIHYGVGADGKYDVPRIADAVAEADIVCLQEVTRGFPDNNYADHTAEIGKRLKCGTNCGSCVPEIQAIIGEVAKTAATEVRGERTGSSKT